MSLISDLWVSNDVSWWWLRAGLELGERREGEGVCQVLPTQPVQKSCVHESVCV